MYWGLFWHGTEELKPILGAPVAASPAAASGMQSGERVIKVGGELVQTWQDMHWVLIRQAVDQDLIDLEVINPVSYTHLDVYKRQGNEKLTLTIAANYGGRWDILQAVNRMAMEHPEKQGAWSCLLYTSRCV